MLASEPKHWAALMMLGYCYEGLDRHQDALATAERALEGDPYDFRALQLAGRAAARLEDQARAKTFIERALGIEPPPDPMPQRLYAFIRTLIGLPGLRRLFRTDARDELDPSAHHEELARWKEWAKGYLEWLEAGNASSNDGAAEQ